MAENGSSGWNLQRKDGIYALVLAALTGGQVIDRTATTQRAGIIEVLTEKVAALEHNVSALQDPGGPVLRQTVVEQRNHEDEIKELQGLVRGMVSRDTIEDVKQRLSEGKDADREIRSQIENLRNSIDALRLEIQKASAARLVGPNR